MAAYKNGRKTWLSEEVLNAVGGDPAIDDAAKLSTSQIVQRFFSKFSKDRLAPLFITRRMGTMSTYSSSSFPLNPSPNYDCTRISRLPQADANNHLQRAWFGSVGPRLEWATLSSMPSFHSTFKTRVNIKLPHQTILFIAITPSPRSWGFLGRL